MHFSTLSCAMAAAAMMMTCVRTEASHVIMGFSRKLVNLGINTQDTLDVVMRKTQDQNFGATNCALPMLWAMENKVKDIDVFIIYTDNETWYVFQGMQSRNSCVQRETSSSITLLPTGTIKVQVKSCAW